MAALLMTDIAGQPPSFCEKHPMHWKCQPGTTSTTTTTTESPPSAYPASFFTGPLGSRNVVPNDPNGGLISMWSAVTGWTTAQQRAFLEQRMADSGRTFDLVGMKLDSLNGVTGEDWAHSLGSIPSITWSPPRSTAEIASGASDAEIDAIAARLGGENYRIMLRLFHEMNEPSVSYYVGTSDASAANFRAAWQHVVQRFQRAGADNIGFWWCPGEQAGGIRTWINAGYPGDAYVDWVGSDGYNGASPNFYSTPAHSGWATFKEVFDYPSYTSMLDQWGGRKPFVIGETGTKYDATDINRKGNWYRSIDTSDMSALRGVQFFDVNVIPQEPNDWRVDSNQTATQTTSGTFSAESYQGWKDFVRIARWNVGVAGS